MEELIELEKQIENLLEEKKYHAIRELLSVENCADVAQLLDGFPEKDLIVLFRLLPKELAAETFAYMDSDACEALIRAFSDAELRSILDELYVDDAVDIIEELPANVVNRILKVTDAETRGEINRLLNYPEDSAGSIMTTEYVSLPKNITCAEAISQIRKTGINKETIYTCYVTENRKLLGVITVRDMLTGSEDAIIGDIMEENFISVTTSEDKEDVAKMFDKYDFLALPVLDNEGRIVGIVTVDDAMDVMRAEAAEDIEVMAAITPSDKPYLKTGVFRIMLKRIPWLFLLMISATFTGGIITSFEQKLGLMPILTAYIPMLMDTGGNAGGQTSVTVIRGLALDEIRVGDIFRVIWKEIRVAAVCGVLLAAANFAKIMLFDRLVLGSTDVTPSVAFAVCITLAVTVLIAKFVGAVLPILAKKLKFDPAVMASPFITTIVDALALLTYFRVSLLIIAELA